MRTILRMSGGTAIAAALALSSLPGALAGQTPPPPAPPAPGAAESYQAAFADLARLAPVAGQAADVRHLVLTRDVARLVLERGKLYWLSPVQGRTVGAVFRGEGRFTFAPDLPAEQVELKRIADSTTLDDSITEAILIFADSTDAQLGSLTFTAGDVPGEVADHVRDFVNSLKGDKDGSFDAGILEPILNGERSGLFLARLTPTRGDQVLFELDPDLSEPVQLYRPVSRRRWGAPWALVVQLPQFRSAAGPPGVAAYRPRLDVNSYRMDVVLHELVSGNLELRATATLALRADEPVGPWLLFRLHPKLTADSARLATGRAAPLFKADESGDLWVRVGGDRALRHGDTLSLTVYYHGDVIDRYGDFFYVDPSAAWFPVNGQGENDATFDVTFHSPSQYVLVGTGDRVDSALAGRVRETRWVTPRPTPFATFNVGLFEDRPSRLEGAPPIHVYLSDEAHALLRRQLASLGVHILEQRHMAEAVAADVSNSLKLFTYLFGPCPADHFNVTEIPYSEGVSFPGLIELSWGTFANTSLDGFDEFFRAHEAAHQWWGIGVLPGSYRDAWLTEGLASFSGLWYVQAVRKHNNEYFRFLDQYQADIRADREAMGPIAIGYRNATPDAPRGYTVMVYEKGAWVFHMLRNLLLDLSTMRDDRFLAMMRDYYQSYGGRPATVDDFRRVVERHTGMPMGWFFDEWIEGTGMPEYRVAWHAESAEGGRWRVRFRVSQEGVPASFRMPVLVSVDLGGQRTARFRVDVHGAQGEYLSPLLPAEPRGVVFNDLHSTLARVGMERW
jgi:hypothetical protein